MILDSAETTHTQLSSGNSSAQEDGIRLPAKLLISKSPRSPTESPNQFCVTSSRLPDLTPGHHTGTALVTAGGRSAGRPPAVGPAHIGHVARFNRTVPSEPTAGQPPPWR
ncbi:hypothetical protein SAV31267_100250 [Streptomyces avermitilis]|uniref:Uncharacterized protein n=1 Tax=Streptomyces avermitilis TaxID=33903 RepID=A0A4D4N7Z1_STRAX|nr:hypothetical protein SAV31267_100250 [Streptomyces avermitilis]